ncbi:MAG: HEPN domain-containing protein [Bacteroidales bacterium]|nr:HEPN domain-containing protein [Bacteroidales bacterium]
MISEKRKSYVQFRIESAYKTHEAAKLLFEKGFWNSSVNRLYYSVFYAVNALLVLEGIQTKTHASVKSQFSQRFVKSGELDPKFGKLLNQLFDWRQKGDYENLFDYKEADVAPLLLSTLEMINKIDEKIKNAL